MRVGENITIHAGAEPLDSSRIQEKKPLGQEEEQRKTLFAGNMGGMTVQDRILQKREQAQKQAMKIVGEAWEKDRAIDTGLEESRERSRALQQENQEYRQAVQDIEDQQAKLKDAWGDTESEEYLQQQSDLEDQKAEYQRRIGVNEGQIIGENAGVRATRRERLKYNPMVKAQKVADGIMEAAGKDAMGMLLDEGREHIDEQQQEREEQAEKLEEKREEQEKLIEERMEHKSEMEDVGDVPAEEIISLDKVQSDIEQQIQDIMKKMNLVSEDLKGAVVDENL